MEKYRTKLAVLCNGIMLVIFAVVAIASSSTQDVYNNVDSFVDGWNYGKSLTSDATDAITPAADLDSIVIALPDVACVDSPEINK